MRGIKNFLIFMMVMVCLMCTPMGVFASNSSNNKSGIIETDDFTIKVVCGIQGNYKVGAAIPVYIDIESKSGDFSGIVRLIDQGSTTYNLEATAYEKEILLNQNSPKRVTLSAYGGATSNKFIFQLENDKGKLLIEEGVKIASKANQNALVGVLSEDYTAFNYMDKIPFNLKNYDGQTQLVELNEEDIPEHFSGMEALSYLIIDKFDTSKLTKEQIGAVTDWISNGGVLIVSGGSDCKQTLSGLSDVISLKNVKNEKNEISIVSKEQDEKKDILTFEEDGSLVAMEIDGAESLTGVISKSELIKNINYNKGHIVVTGFNLGMEPVISWDKRSKFAKSLFEQSAKGYSSVRIGSLNWGSYSDLWSIRNAINNTMEEQYPHVGAILWILIVFGFFAGITYFVLKKFDKRELMWTIIPVSSVVFTIIIFVVNSDIRIKYPVLTSMTMIVDQEDEEETANSATVAMGVLVPSTKHTTVLTNEKLINPKVTSFDDDYHDPGSNVTWNSDYTTAIRQTADGYLLGYDNTSTFQTKYLTFDYTGDNKCGNGLEVSYKRTVTGISGKITNKTNNDMTYVCVFAYGKIVPVGEIKKGQTVEFTEDDNSSFFNNDIYSVKFPGVTSGTKEYSNILYALTMANDSYVYNDLENDRSLVFTVGYIRGSDFDYIQDEKVKEYNQTIYIKSDSVNYSDYENAQMLNLFTYAQESDKWDMNDGQLYSTNAEVEFDLYGAVDDVYALIRAKNSESRYGNTKNTKIYAMNVNTSQYEELFVNGEVMTFDKECPYIGEDGKIKMKFTCNQTYEDWVPFITLVGGAR